LIVQEAEHERSSRILELAEIWTGGIFADAAWGQFYG
jgi:hypothetical protein